MAEDGFAGRDVPPLIVNASQEKATRRRLVDRVGPDQMIVVTRQEVWLEDPVNTDQPLDGLPGRRRLLDGVHEGDDPLARRLRDLGVGAQLGQAPAERVRLLGEVPDVTPDRKSTRLNSSHGYISYAVFCLKKKKKTVIHT